MPPARPLLVVSNRLPVSLRLDAGKPSTRRSAGGLATALGGVVDGETLWVGWPGAAIPPTLQDSVRTLLERDRLSPVFLTDAEERDYYHGFSNSALWPLFHYFTSYVSHSESEWQGYVEVNDRFARHVAEIAPDGARVWIHDFHLMLVPSHLRDLRPDLEIGFFLHIPFPSSEIYRVLPRRERLLEGVLGADYVGFHTDDYARHFRSACDRVIGTGGDQHTIEHDGRRIAIGADPIGIDTAAFDEVLHRPRTVEIIRELATQYQGRKLLLGVERLDYTKGILLKLEAFERFLARDPKRAREVALIQVLVPSRVTHPDYKQLKAEIDEVVGRINGSFGAPGVNPVEHMHTSLEPEQLVALYRYSHAALVTPLRDGMNLVAQEYVFCQGLEHDQLRDEPGTLVLSEFAGAAHNLLRALQVNPWDLESTADQIERALSMSVAERRLRIRSMADTVRALDCHNWSRTFLDKLATAGARSRERAVPTALGSGQLDDLSRRFAAAPRRALLLDYDGTLREIARSPGLAQPTAEIHELLESLAALEHTEVHVVSGRARNELQVWFGHHPIHLCAEHGFAWRPLGGTWHELDDIDLGWKERLTPILEELTRDVAGSLLENKRGALAWHYRAADEDQGPARARWLCTLLEREFAGAPIDVLEGRKVVEVRSAGVHKGRYTGRIVAALPPEAFILCIGDDRTDEDMYRSVRSRGTTIHVGEPRPDADHTIASPRRVRELLRNLVESMAPVP